MDFIKLFQTLPSGLFALSVISAASLVTLVFSVIVPWLTTILVFGLAAYVAYKLKNLGFFDKQDVK